MIRFLIMPLVTMVHQMVIMSVCVGLSFVVGGLVAYAGYAEYAPGASLFTMVWLGGLIIGLARSSKGV